MERAAFSVQDIKYQPTTMAADELLQAKNSFPILQNIDKYEKLSDKHPFVRIRNFFAKEECDAWLKYAKTLEKDFSKPNYTPEAAAEPHTERKLDFIVSSFHQFTLKEIETEPLVKALSEKNKQISYT